MTEIKHIAHAAGASDVNEIGFVHAVGLAAHGGARLTSVHACATGAPAIQLPDASELLSRWGMARDRVRQERVQHACCDDVDDTLLDALDRLKPDLVVASTHARAGLARILFGSVAEGVARNLRAPTLLLPLDGTWLVDAASGATRLWRMLLPVGRARDAARAIGAAAELARLAGGQQAELLLVHVEGGTGWPELEVPPGLSLQRVTARGPLDAAIAQLATSSACDALVMVTHGHDGLDDVLRASHTERALHACGRPLLWVPASP